MKTLGSGTRNVIGTSTTTTTHATTSFLPSPAERGDIPLRSFCLVQKFETSSPSLSLSGAVGGTQRRDRTKTRLRRNPRPFGPFRVGRGGCQSPRADYWRLERREAFARGNRKKTGREKLRPVSIFRYQNELILRGSQFVREDSLKSPLFVLVVQQHHRDHAQRSLAGMALRYFALQILQKAVREMIQCPLASGIFLVPCTAVRTDKLHFVLLRIAVQSSPTRAAYAYGLDITPFHRDNPPSDPRPQSMGCAKPHFRFM